MSGYEIQQAAASLVDQAPRAMRQEQARTAVPPGTYEKGGDRFYYPTLDDTMATDVLADVLPHARELGVTDEEFDAIDRYSEDMAGVAVILVDGIAEAGVDLNIDDSLRVQAQLVRAFAEARRTVLAQIDKLGPAEAARFQDRALAPGTGVLTDDEERKILGTTFGIVDEMLGALPTKLKLPQEDIDLCRQHFIWAEFYGVNSALAEKEFPYYY